MAVFIREQALIKLRHAAKQFIFALVHTAQNSDSQIMENTIGKRRSGRRHGSLGTRLGADKKAPVQLVECLETARALVKMTFAFLAARAGAMVQGSNQPHTGQKNSTEYRGYSISRASPLKDSATSRPVLALVFTTRMP